MSTTLKEHAPPVGVCKRIHTSEPSSKDSVDSAGVPLVDSGAGQEQLRLSRGNAEYVQKRSSRSYFYSRALNANNCDFVKLWAAAGGIGPSENRALGACKNGFHGQF